MRKIMFSIVALGLLSVNFAYTMDQYTMDLDNVALKCIAQHSTFLKQSYPTLKPITKINSNGAIHAYYSLYEKMTYALITHYNGTSTYFEQLHIYKGQKNANSHDMDIEEYINVFDMWEILEQHGLFIKLPLDQSNN